jgi:hypothetical protein
MLEKKSLVSLMYIKEFMKPIARSYSLNQMQFVHVGLMKKWDDEYEGTTFEEDEEPDCNYELWKKTKKVMTPEQKARQREYQRMYKARKKQEENDWKLVQQLAIEGTPNVSA